MAIIQINSTDPKFGYIIKKNPSSEMQVRTIRKGAVFAWYSNNGESYNILFKDADNAVSFGDQEFEFLNTSRYNSPLFVINAIGEFFTANVREQVQDDTEGNEKSFIVTMVDIARLGQIKQFNKYFPGFNVEIELHAAKSYKLIITTKESFHKLFNFMNLMMLFLALSSKSEYMQLDQSGIEKYMQSIERLDAPFFIRYLFSRAMFRSKNQFGRFKERLEATEKHDKVTMVYGDTAMQRRTAIEKIIPFDKHILDVGCGEGFYAIPFSQKIKEHQYIAIDIVKDLTDTVEKKAEKKEIKNILTFNSLSQFLEVKQDGKYDVILTEVIEHMPKEQSIELILTILENIDFDNFIITVPNKDFNTFYMIDDGQSRHDDHDWEPSEVEFKDFMAKIIPLDFSIKYLNIGDTIDSISTSIGCIITKD
jgi:SAM-dependent methyltransferase